MLGLLDWLVSVPGFAFRLSMRGSWHSEVRYASWETLVNPLGHERGGLGTGNRVLGLAYSMLGIRNPME